jgi:hypothetical protein
MPKGYPDAGRALEGLLFDGMTIAVGGFGLSGNPTDLIEAVRDSGVSGLTIVSNNMGTDGKGPRPADFPGEPPAQRGEARCGRAFPGIGEPWPHGSARR